MLSANNNQDQVIQFFYDDAGRRTKTIHANGIVQDYSYDEANQLTGTLLMHVGRSNPALSDTGRIYVVDEGGI